MSPHAEWCKCLAGQILESGVSRQSLVDNGFQAWEVKDTILMCSQGSGLMTLCCDLSRGSKALGHAKGGQQEGGRVQGPASCLAAAVEVLKAGNQFNFVITMQTTVTPAFQGALMCTPTF